MAVLCCFRLNFVMLFSLALPCAVLSRTFLYPVFSGTLLYSRPACWAIFSFYCFFPFLFANCLRSVKIAIGWSNETAAGPITPAASGMTGSTTSAPSPSAPVLVSQTAPTPQVNSTTQVEPASSTAARRMSMATDPERARQMALTKTFQSKEAEVTVPIDPI